MSWSRAAAAVVIAMLLLGLWLLRARDASVTNTQHVAAARASSAAAVVLNRGELSGNVVTENGAPVAHASVCAYCSNCDVNISTAIACVESIADGSFALNRLPPGKYRLAAAATRFVSKIDDDVHPLNPGERRTGLHVVLSFGGATLAGTVSDALGGAVAGARVLLVDNDGRLSGHADTNADGEFEVWAHPGSFSVIAQANGYSAEQRSVVVPSGDLSIVLMPASSIAGSVVDHRTGVGLPNVTVRAIPKEISVAEAAPFAVSDRSGHFRVTSLGPGAYRLSAVAPGWRGDGVRVVHLGVAEAIDNLTIAVAPATHIDGRVLTKPEGLPCARGYVTLSSPQAQRLQRMSPEEVQRSFLAAAFSTETRVPADLSLSSRIDRDGRVSFDGVPHGSYVVGVQCQGFSMNGEPPTVDVHEAPTPAQEWAVSPAPGIAVRAVNDADELQTHASVAIRALDDPQTILPPREPGGRFVARNLRPGVYVVSQLSQTGAEPQGAGNSHTIQLTGTSGLVEITLKLGSVGGLRVSVLRPDGTRYNGLTVTAVSVEPSGVFVSDNVADGSYALDALAAGDYEVHVSDGHNVTAIRPVSVRSGQTSELDLEYGFSGRIRGHVVDEHGAPVGNAWVDSASESIDAKGIGRDPRRGKFADTAITAMDGSFELMGLSEGDTHTVRVEVPEQTGTSLAGVRTGSDVRLVLPAPLVVRGTVVDGLGQPVPRFLVSVQHAETGMVRQQRAEDRDGHFRLEGVPPGKVAFHAIDPLGRVASLNTQLSPRDTSNELTLVINAR